MSKSPRNGFRACAGGRPRRSSAGADSGASGRPPRSREQSPRAGAGQSPPGGTADLRTPSGPSSDSSQSPRTGRAAGGGRHLRREPRGDSAGVALLASSDFWTTPRIAPPCAPGAVLAASGSLLGVGNRVRERVRQRAEGPSPPSIGARRRPKGSVRGAERRYRGSERRHRRGRPVDARRAATSAQVGGNPRAEARRRSERGHRRDRACDGRRDGTGERSAEPAGESRSGSLRLRERELEKWTSQKRAEARTGTVERSGVTAERDREPPAKTPVEGMLPVNFDRVSAEPVRQRKREASGGPRPAVDRSTDTAQVQRAWHGKTVPWIGAEGHPERRAGQAPAYPDSTNPSGPNPCGPYP